MSVPIPGEILKSDIAFGLSFDEIVGLGTIPLVLILPTVFFQAIPLWVTGVVLALGTLGVGWIILKSPKGQSPVEWFPAYIDSQIKPDKYTLKPKDSTQYGTPEIKYLDIVYTREEIREEEEMELEEADKFKEHVSDIRYAEKLELPEWVQEAEEETDERNRLAVDIMIAIKNKLMYNRVTNPVRGVVDNKLGDAE